MKQPIEPAPIYTDIFRLNAWLHARLGNDTRILSRSICRHALQLLSLVVHALKNRERWASLDEADACLITLRTELRLAAATHTLSDDQLLFALDLANRAGRQIGGWLRALDVE